MTSSEHVTMPAADLLAKAYAQGRLQPTPILLDGGRQAILKPRDAEFQIIDPIDRKEADLKRIASRVTLHDEESFIAYVNRYKSDRTQVFAVPGFLSGGKAQVTAVFDYHLPDKAQRGEHYATYTPRYSEAWQRWHAACAKPLKQVEFAELIEECSRDIAEPSAAGLMTIVRTFKAAKKTDFDSVVYQPNGAVTLNYSEQVEQKGSSGSLPESMKLGIPVYFRGEAYAVTVLIRYRVGGGGVQFDLKMDRSDVIEDEAFSHLLSSIAQLTEVKPYLGSVSGSFS